MHKLSQVRKTDKTRLHFFHTKASYLTGLRLPMLRYLAAHGYEVTAHAPDMNEGIIGRLNGFGIKCEAYSLDCTGLNPWRDFMDTLKLVRQLRAQRPDVVFSNNIKPVVFVTIASAIAGIPSRHALVGGLGYAFTAMPQGAVSRSRSVARIVATVMYAVAFRLCKRVIFHNRDDLNLMVASGVCPASKGEVVAGSGVDVKEFFPANHPDIPTFIFVGRLLADKGIREFMIAARETKNRFPKSRFIVVGDVDGNPSAIDPREVEQAAATGLIDWVGRVDDVRPYLHQASVFVLPSYREGIPRSTLEAMACGLAVVTTDAPGCRETVIPGRNGLMVPACDPQALSEALCALCQDPYRIGEMGVESRLIVEDRFSSDRVNGEILELIRGE